MVLTSHASKRCKQRGIPIAVASVILNVGDSFDGGRGCQILVTRSKLAKVEFRDGIEALGLKYKKRWESAYVIVDPENIVVTAGHRTKKIRTDIKFNYRGSYY